MKRSEMVKALAAKLYSDNLTQNMDENASHHVLLFLENSGMLPPRYYEDRVDIDGTKNKCRIFFTKWEKE